MSGKKPKTYNSLMKYMRDEKGISITGVQKRKLRNMGYYHGYKGYRFINKPVNAIPYSTFEELSAIYDFDAKLKAVFYPWVMRIETGIKNYVLEVVLAETSSENFVDIYTKLLDNYKMFTSDSGVLLFRVFWLLFGYTLRPFKGYRLSGLNTFVE